MTLAEAAEALGVTPGQVLTAIQEGRIRGLRAGDEWYVDKRAIEPIEREAAKERQGERTDLEHCANFAPSSTSGKSRQKVADACNVSHETLRKAEKVVEAAEADPETFEPQ